MEVESYAIYCVVLCLSHLVQGITGFGAIVLALPVLTFFFPLKTLIPALIVVNLIQTTWLVATERKHIHSRHARTIVLLSLVGLPFGYAVYRFLPSDQLKIGLGMFVVIVATWNLSGFTSKRQAPLPLYYLLNLMGGFVQGAIASGGPFMVIYAARMLKDKSAFRATLSVVWTVLNVILCCTYTATQTWSSDMLPLIGLALPCMALGTALGMALHQRIPEKPFRTLVFSILLVSGLVLLRPLVS